MCFNPWAVIILFDVQIASPLISLTPFGFVCFGQVDSDSCSQPLFSIVCPRQLFSWLAALMLPEAESLDQVFQPKAWLNGVGVGWGEGVGEGRKHGGGRGWMGCCY